jgi:hypothetical protein
MRRTPLTGGPLLRTTADERNTRDTGPVRLDCINAKYLLHTTYTGGLVGSDMGYGTLFQLIRLEVTLQCTMQRLHLSLK